MDWRARVLLVGVLFWGVAIGLTLGHVWWHTEVTEEDRAVIDCARVSQTEGVMRVCIGEVD